MLIIFSYRVRLYALIACMNYICSDADSFPFKVRVEGEIVSSIFIYFVYVLSNCVKI